MPSSRCAVCLVFVSSVNDAGAISYCSQHQPPTAHTSDGRRTSGGCRLHDKTNWHEGKRRCRTCEAEAARRRRQGQAYRG